MTPKSGSAGSPVGPVEPAEMYEADNADPGEMAEIKGQQAESKAGKYGSTPVQHHKPTAAGGGGDGGGGPASAVGEDESKQEKKVWIEIKLIDEEDQPVPGEPYKIELPDGSIASGTLDQNGFARVDGIDPGTCQITFHKLDKDSWESV